MIYSGRIRQHWPKYNFSTSFLSGIRAHGILATELRRAHKIWQIRKI